MSQHRRTAHGPKSFRWYTSAGFAEHARTLGLPLPLSSGHVNCAPYCWDDRERATRSLQAGWNVLTSRGDNAYHFLIGGSGA